MTDPPEVLEWLSRLSDAESVRVVYEADGKRGVWDCSRFILTEVDRNSAVPAAQVVPGVTFVAINRYSEPWSGEEPLSMRLVCGRRGMRLLSQVTGADELRALAAEAGFQRVEIEPVSMTARFPNPDAFLAGESDVDTAAIPSTQHLDAKARQAIVAAITADMDAHLKDVTHNNHVVIQFHA